jgi:hypothetical protein
MSWLADTMLQSITVVMGFDTGGSTVFLSWLEFSASPTLSPSCEMQVCCSGDNFGAKENL